MFDLTKLGVVKNIPKVSFTDYTGLIIGPPKFGKTTIASKFPNSIIVPFEKGTKAAVANVVKQMESWDDFIEFVDKLEDNRKDIGDSVKTIVFDTITAAYDSLESYTLRHCSRLDGAKYKTPGDMQGAKSNFWIERDKLLRKQIDRLTDMQFTVLFLSHLKVKTIKPKKGDSYEVYSSTMSDRLDGIIKPLVDFIIMGEERMIEDSEGNKERKRVLIFKSTDVAEGNGHRVHLTNDIVFDTETEAMEKFQAEFRKGIERKLEEAGVTESYEEIEQKQKEEKNEEIDNYIKANKKFTAEELVKEIESIIADHTDKKVRLKIKNILETELGTFNYAEVQDVDVLHSAVAEIKKELSLT